MVYSQLQLLYVIIFRVYSRINRFRFVSFPFRFLQETETKWKRNGWLPFPKYGNGNGNETRFRFVSVSETETAAALHCNQNPNIFRVK